MDPSAEMTDDAKVREPSRASKHSELEIRDSATGRPTNTIHEIVDEGSEAGKEREANPPHAEKPPHGYPAPKHPVWHCFSQPKMIHEHAHAAHLRTVAQSRVVVVCKFCNAELERDTAFAKDEPEPVDEVQAMRAVLHDMVHHLKSGECESCPENLRHEMLQWPPVSIPLGGEHHGDRPASPSPFEAPTKPTVAK